MSERRSVRESTRRRTEQSEARRQQEEISQQRATLQRQSLIESRQEAKRRNLIMLRESYFGAKLSKDEKLRMLTNFNQKYLWEYDIWRDYLLQCIDNDDFEAVLIYLEKITPTRSSSGILRISIDNMDFMTELLDRMRDKKRPYLFWDRPYWDNLLMSNGGISTDWWNEHIFNSLSDSDYIYKLTKSKWKFITNEVLLKAINMPKATINHIIQAIYASDYPSYQRFNGSEMDIGMLMALQSTKLSDEQKANQRYYLKTLILKRANSKPPLTIAIRASYHGNPAYVFNTLFEFISLAIDMNEMDILEDVVSAFNMKNPENMAWLSFLLECIIRPKYMEQYRYTDNTFNIEKCKKVISFLISAYKININNVYMNMRDLFAGDRQPTDPIGNPKIWLDKQVPPIAWAILYENLDVIDFLIQHGALLNRCAISMQDLTNNPAILGRFTRETKATKIQRRFKEYYYSPSHPSQSKRAEEFRKKYQTVTPISEVPEETSASSSSQSVSESAKGGKNKITKKIRNTTKKTTK